MSLKSKSKICIILPNLNLGGAQLNTIRIAKILENIYEVYFIVLRNDGFYINEFNKLQSKKIFFRKSKYKIASIYNFYKLLEKINPDYLFTGIYFFNLLIIVFAKFIFINNVKIIIRETAVISKMRINFILKSIYFKIINLADVIISQSTDMTNDFVHNGKINPNKVFQIENPVYKQNIKNLSKSTNKNYYLIIGRLEKEKNVLGFLKAFNKIKNKPNILIIGEGSELKKIKTYVSLNLLEKFVKIIGYQKKIGKYFLNSKALILPSMVEGFPNIAIESLSFGTPVLSNSFSGGINQIINKTNGLVIDISNPIELEFAFNYFDNNTL